MVYIADARAQRRSTVDCERLHWLRRGMRVKLGVCTEMTWEILTSTLKSTFAHVPEGLRSDILPIHNMEWIAYVHAQRRFAPDCKVPGWFRCGIHMKLGVAAADQTPATTCAQSERSHASLGTGYVLAIPPQ